MKCFWYIFLVLVISAEFFASQVRQEGAKINCNVKYVRDCYAITRRVRRGEPYRSNYTVKTLQTWDNNVTMRIVMFQGGIPLEIVKQRVCDAFSLDWLLQFYKTHLNVEPACPIKPGVYEMLNLEFPPKNMPQNVLKLLKGDFYAKFYFQLTKTEEIIIESSVNIHYSH